MKYGAIPIAVISTSDLLRNKKALGRPRDLADVEEIEEFRRPPKGSTRG